MALPNDQLGAGGPPAPRIDFIGVGAQRSGTSWLFNCLTQHPAISGPVAGAGKEVNFFNHHYTRGYHWYHSLFDFGALTVGEFSVLYAPEPSVPERIRRYRADVLLLACVRDPVERAYSHHLHEIRRGRVPPELYEFDAAADGNPTYVDQGRYFTHLSRFYDLFPRDQIRVVVLDDVRDDPGAVMSDTYRFLGVDAGFRPSLATKVVNAARPSRSAFLERALRLGSEAVRRTAGERAHIRLRQGALGRQVVQGSRREFRPDEVPPISESTEADLRRLFAPEVAGLGELLGRDLSHWTASADRS